jgi:hypothetical protein
LTGPVDIPTITDSTKIGVSLPVVTADGGSMITSYHLMMDDGMNGDFISVVGGENQVANLNRQLTITNGVVKGRTYRFKYRVRNQIGWSDFSTTTYILAANPPSKPPAPTYVSSTNT